MVAMLGWMIKQNWMLHTLARNCCAAQQIHKSNNVVAVFLWNASSYG